MPSFDGAFFYVDINIINFMNLNIVYNDSCQNALDWLEEKSVDLILTSPPYADIRKYGHSESQCSADKYVDWFLPKAEIFGKVLKDTGSFILNMGDRLQNRCQHPYVFELIIALEKQCGFRRYETIFWDKSCSPPSNKRFRPTTEYIFWLIKKGSEKTFKFYLDKGRVPYSENTKGRYSRSKTATWHTRDSEKEKCPECSNRMKPIKEKYICGNCNYEKKIDLKQIKLHPEGALPSTLLRMGSESRNTGPHNAVFPKKLPSYFIPIATDEGDVVFDPFMGSGTTALSCIDLKRNYVGSEIVEERHKDCLERIEKYRQKLSLKKTLDLF